MRKSLRASVLVLALCSPTLAGNMPCPPVAPPPPSAAEEPTAQGEIPCPPLIEIALTLLALL